MTDKQTKLEHDRQYLKDLRAFFSNSPHKEQSCRNPSFQLFCCKDELEYERLDNGRFGPFKQIFEDYIVLGGRSYKQVVVHDINHDVYLMNYAGWSQNNGLDWMQQDWELCEPKTVTKTTYERVR